ncbi:MAG: hypothetical protein H5T71_01065 [Chloroflexi bacterium]|nr:hypothetical protein [Chloroflexota bacterium]
MLLRRDPRWRLLRRRDRRPRLLRRRARRPDGPRRRGCAARVWGCAGQGRGTSLVPGAILRPSNYSRSFAAPGGNPSWLARRSPRFSPAMPTDPVGEVRDQSGSLGG